MSANELSAKEIESRPANEANYELSQRIYESARQNPEQFQAITRQLDADSKNDAASGVNLETDGKGNVTAISINNENLYKSSDATVPKQLATARIVDQIEHGDTAAARDEGFKVAGSLGMLDALDTKQAVFDTISTKLGEKLKNPDSNAARAYLGALQSNKDAEPSAVLALLQKAKEQSGLGDRVQIETDKASGALTAFKVDGQDLLKPAVQATETTADAPKDAPAAPPADAPKDAPKATDVQSDVAPAPTAATGDNKEPADLYKPERSEIPAETAKSADSAKSTEQAKVDRDSFEKAMGGAIDGQNKSAAIKRGEGYYQVVSRMHKDWTDEQIMKETHHLKDLNNRANELKVGQQLALHSPAEIAAAKQKQMETYDKASPEEKQKMLEAAKKAQSDAVAPPVPAAATRPQANAHPSSVRRAHLHHGAVRH